VLDMIDVNIFESTDMVLCSLFALWLSKGNIALT